jgi:hypothetical protein
MGLVLYKQSGQCYRLLSRLFCLQSRKTMMSLLRRIPIKTGINKVIFNNLKTNVEYLAPRDRFCVLIFDDMAIEPHINLNQYTKELWRSKKLKYCTPNYINGICTCYNIIKHFLPKLFAEDNAFTLLEHFLQFNVKFEFKEDCPHVSENKNIIINKFLSLCCHNWCRGINRILSGNDDRSGKHDEIFTQARKYYTSRIKNKRTIV